MSVTYTVAFYEIDRAYGGPEEGGWWYNTGHLIRIFKTYKTETAAYKACRRANAILRHLNKGNIDSVVYAGGNVAAEVYDGIPPRNYPETRPYYE